MIYLHLFLAFLQIGLFSIGGGYAAIPLISAQAVDKYGWLSLSEFTDLVSIAEMTPGPVALNAATFTGTRIAGFTGALVATAGCVLPSLIIVTVLAVLYKKYGQGKIFGGVLSALRPAVVGLIGAAFLGIFFLVMTGSSFSFGGFAAALKDFRVTGALLFALALLVIRKFKFNPILTMLACGLVNLILGLILPRFALT